jgi:hypothetical protein
MTASLHGDIISFRLGTKWDNINRTIFSGNISSSGINAIKSLSRVSLLFSVDKSCVSANVIVGIDHLPIHHAVFFGNAPVLLRYSDFFSFAF